MNTKDGDFMKPLTIKLVAADLIDKEYNFEYNAH